MKRTNLLKILLLLLTICTLLCGIGCKNNKDEEVGTGRFLKVETEKTEFVFEVGDTYTTPFAYIVDSIEDRVDGVPVTTELYNPNGDLLDSVVQDQITVKFVRTGTFSIVYSAEDVESFTIKLNVCRKLAKPTNFVKDGNTLSWDAVKGATCGYMVSVNGGEAVKVDSPSFTSDTIKGQGFYVSVVAIGDKVSYVDSNAGLYQNRLPLNEYELASFNDYNYCLDIVEGSPKNTNILAVPEFVPNCEGSNGGALKLSLVAGTYGWTIFRLNLQETFNVNDISATGGIEIRFKLDSQQYTNSTLFQLLRPYDAEYCASIKVSPETNNEWMVLRASMSGKLPNSYTSEEDFSHLQLNVYNLVRAGGKGDLYLDYIKIYNDVVETPTNLALDNNILTWDNVADASSYTVEASVLNGNNLEVKTFVANTNSIDLSELADKQYNVRVQANPNVGNKVTSSWSAYVGKRDVDVLADNAIADFSNPLYINDISGTTNILDKDGKVAFQSHLKSVVYNGDGAVKIELSNNWRVSNFNVKLYKPLDLEKDGIEIRFKVESTTYLPTNPMIFKLAAKTNFNDYDYKENNSVAVNVGNWQVLKISSEQLSKAYVTGDDVLYFTFVTKDGINGQTVVALIDDISYYEQLDTPTNVQLDNKVLSWDAVTDATSYNVEVSYLDGTEVKTKLFQAADTTINLSEYAEFNARVQAVSTGMYDSEWSDIKGHRNVSGDTLADFNNGLYTENVKSSNINSYLVTKVTSTKYNAEGNVEVQVVNDGWKHANFKVDLGNNACDLRSNGISIRFKVISSSYTSGSLYFKLVDTNANHYATNQDGIEVVVGVWQTLSITNENLSSWLKSEWSSLYFCINSTSGLKGATVTVLLDDISYYEARELSVPTNLTFDKGVLSWAAVDGATSYNIKVNQYNNGELTTTSLTSNTNSIDLSTYGECEVIVQAVASAGETSSFSSICSNRTNVLFDFNNQTGPEIASTTTANGLTASVVNNVTYNEDGTVKIAVKSSYNNQNFNIIPETKSLDFKAGIAIRFKVESTGYAAGTQLYFQYVGAGASSGYGSVTAYGTPITIGEWQTLVLTSEQIAASGYYVANSTNAWKLHFTILAVGGNNGNAVANILIDDISYITVD